MFFVSGVGMLLVSGEVFGEVVCVCDVVFVEDVICGLYGCVVVVAEMMRCDGDGVVRDCGMMRCMNDWTFLMIFVNMFLSFQEAGPSHLYALYCTHWPDFPHVVFWLFVCLFLLLVFVK